MNTDTDAVIARPEITQQMIADGAMPGGNTPERFGTFTRAPRRFESPGALRAVMELLARPTLSSRFA